MGEESSAKFVKILKDLLEKNKPEEALDHFKNNGNEKLYFNTANELVPIIADNLNSKNLINNKILFQTCEKLLDIFAANCDPADMILLLCEQAETFDNDVRFQALLGPLVTSMRKGDLSESIDFFTVSTRAYIEDLPVPDDEKPQQDNDKNKLADKSNEISIRLTTFHESIVSNLAPLTQDIFNNFTTIKPKIIYSFLNLFLNLFGKPFSHLKIKFADEEKSSFYLLVEQILLLESDPFRLLKIIDNRRKKIEKKTINSDEDENQTKSYIMERRFLDLEVSNLAYANFFYALITSAQLKSQVPQVYHPHYVMNNCFFLANHLLGYHEYVFVAKGLRLTNTIIKNIDKESISHEALKLPVHINLLTSLSQVMMYNDCAEERQLSLKVFKNYIDLFTMRARHLLIQHLFETKRHSGFRALIINILKSLIIKSLDAGPPCKYFLGNKLKTIIKKICKLPEGDVTDLVDISDEVTGVLNLLRFLLIRDKLNVTGIWDIIDSLDENYLKRLTKEITISRNHWKVEVNELEQKKNNPEKTAVENEEKVSVNVGGMNLPDISIVEKIKMGHQALTAIDIIESILMRVNECLEFNPLKDIIESN